MDEFLTSLLVIGTEFGMFVGVILMALVYLNMSKKRKDKTVARKFAADFQDFSTSRKVDLEEVIENAFNLGGDATEEYAQIIMKNERKICSNMLRLFNGKDRDLLLQLQGDLANLTDAYKSLASMNQSNGTTGDSASVDDKLMEQMSVLKSDNERLKDDLKKSLESIDYLQAQYTELFKKTNNEKGEE